MTPFRDPADCRRVGGQTTAMFGSDVRAWRICDIIGGVCHVSKAPETGPAVHDDL
jgi:hypothetical protein